MSFQNVIYRGDDTPVIIRFTFTGEFATLGLNNFSRVDVIIDGETYSTTGNEVSIESATELRVKVGTNANIIALTPGEYDLTIKGYSATYDDGYTITHPDNRKISSIKVI